MTSRHRGLTPTCEGGRVDALPPGTLVLTFGCMGARSELGKRNRGNSLRFVVYRTDGLANQADAATKMREFPVLRMGFVRALIGLD